jgi:hypothetical protein
MYIYLVPFSVYCIYKRETETANFRLFAANGNRKLKFVFLGQQTISGNRRLLFPQTCPSLTKAIHSVILIRGQVTNGGLATHFLLTATAKRNVSLP